MRICGSSLYVYHHISCVVKARQVSSTFSPSKLELVLSVCLQHIAYARSSSSILQTSSLAPHFLLFCWVNGLSRKRAMRVVALLCAMMQNAPEDDVEDFVTRHLQLVQDEAEYLSLFLARVSCLLRHPDELGAQRRPLMFVCTRVIGYQGDVFARAEPLRDAPELIQCLIVYCHWNRCNSSAEHWDEAVLSTMEIIR